MGGFFVARGTPKAAFPDNQAPPPRKADLFLSHNRRDKGVVVKLAIDLNFLGVDAWLDEWELSPGDRLHLSVGRALETSRHVAIVLSPNFLDSRWCLDELSQVLAQEKATNANQIIPLLIADVTSPAFLADRLHIDLRTEYWQNLVRLAGHVRGYSSKSVSDVIRRRKPSLPTQAYACLREIGWNGSVVLGRDEFAKWVKHLDVDNLPDSATFEYSFSQEEIERLTQTEVFQRAYRLNELPEKTIGAFLDIDLLRVRAAVFDAIREYLGLREEQINDDSDLFDLGLDSLSVMRCVATIEQRLGLSRVVRSIDFFQAPTIGGLIGRICDRIGIKRPTN